MENKLPEKYESNFFSNIRRFFSSIFRKKAVEEDKEVKTAVKSLRPKENSIESMKELSNKAKLKEDIMEIVEKNPELLRKLSIEKLEELDKMYDKVIAENDMKIKQLSKCAQ